MKHLKMVVLAAGLLSLLGCESKDTKKSAQPGPQAMAPSIQQRAATPVSLSKTPEQQTPAPTQTPQAEKSDPVPEVIAQAEKAYAAG
ncbi:MAG TPA: hypothetical protein VE054_07430, partial [Blattabacteriaceae bacterium]|nr:hypothetical protein [Blattabacteriaceae bacterium]